MFAPGGLSYTLSTPQKKNWEVIQYVDKNAPGESSFRDEIFGDLWSLLLVTFTYERQENKRTREHFFPYFFYHQYFKLTSIFWFKLKYILFIRM